MSTLTAIYHFNVGSLWVQPEVLGTRYSAQVGGYRCTLVFPQDNDDFDAQHDQLMMSPRRPSAVTLLVGWNEALTGEKLKWAVRWVRVEVEIPSELTAEDFPLDGLNEPYPTAISLLRTGGDAASDFISAVIRQTCVRYRQSWLGPSVRRLTFGWKGAYLLDRNGRRIPLNYGPAAAVGRLHLNVNAPGSADLQALVDGIADGQSTDTPLPETLLADALHASSDAEHPDLRLGTLLAAVACEVKVKETMHRLANAEQAALVDLVLDNPRDWSLAASSLFDKGLKAICGRSLKDEDRALWKSVDRLFFVRNKIAHVGGEGLPADALAGHAQVAVRAFEWLNGLLDVQPAS